MIELGIKVGHFEGTWASIAKKRERNESTGG